MYIFVPQFSKKTLHLLFIFASAIIKKTMPLIKCNFVPSVLLENKIYFSAADIIDIIANGAKANAFAENYSELFRENAAI